METTMRNYEIDKDYKCILKGERTGPVLTLEQVNAVVSNYPGGSWRAARLIENLQYEGWLTQIEEPKPKFLPIDRPVRVKDLEPGDVLRFCYEDNGIAPHGGYAVLGSEVVFKRVSTGGDIVYRCTNGQGNIVEDQHCPAKLFSFVRRPFKAGEAVRYKADATKAMGWEGALLVDTSEADRPEGYGVAVINHKGVHGSISATDLERIL